MNSLSTIFAIFVLSETSFKKQYLEAEYEKFVTTIFLYNSLLLINKLIFASDRILDSLALPPQPHDFWHTLFPRTTALPGVQFPVDPVITLSVFELYETPT